MSRMSVMDLNDAAPGTRVKDNEGDLWTKNTDGTWDMTRAVLNCKRWASSSLSGLSVTLISRPGVTAPLAHDELAALPRGSRVSPGIAELVWVRGNHGGWNLEGGTPGKTVSAHFLWQAHEALYLVERGPEPPAKPTEQEAVTAFQHQLIQLGYAGTNYRMQVEGFRAGWRAAQ